MVSCTASASDKSKSSRFSMQTSSKYSWDICGFVVMMIVNTVNVVVVVVAVVFHEVVIVKTV